MNRRTIALCVLPALLCVGVVAVLVFRPKDDGPSFASLEECRTWAQGQGYRVSNPGDWAFWITDDPDVAINALTPVRIPPRCVVVVPARTLPDQYQAQNAVVFGQVAAWGDTALLMDLRQR